VQPIAERLSAISFIASSRDRAGAGDVATGLNSGRYELGDLISYRSMAEMHRCRDVRLGREVAIRILRADLAHRSGGAFAGRRTRETCLTVYNKGGVWHGPAQVTQVGETVGATDEFVTPTVISDALAAEMRRLACPEPTSRSSLG